ncbi:MAG: sugar transferase [candidate division Zixibacteria bacterium]|nr:sugar transferase [candidate division Zixibacteria bacterium]MBU1469686.1 sugar transferase [candidate division Zixibacteria bacterium]MBU2624755.1 sugar transferase [candidate division Zixibacteria bacterium]
MNRVFDIVFSLLILLITLPLTIPIALAVLLTSQGPIFFVQERVGCGGKSFNLYKFRSMLRDDDKVGLQLTLKDDSRVTLIGRFLRRFKLDELPQFLNVAAGTMAVIGPRPEVPKYVASYSPQMREVFDYKPGLTDPASIKFRDEPALLAHAENPERLYIEQILPEKVRLSIEYQRTRTAASDFGIICQTVAIMFGR